MGIDKSKYESIKDPNELIKTLEEDGLIVLEAPDEITGEPLFTLTDKGVEVFEVEDGKEETMSRLSNEIYQLWQHGMVEVEFDNEDYTRDSVILTEAAFDPEKVLLLPREIQIYLATIKRSFEKALDARDEL